MTRRNLGPAYDFDVRPTVDGVGVALVSELGGGGAADITQIEINFGSVAVREKTFTVVDATVTATTQIMAHQAGDAPTGKNADDNEMDAFICRCKAETGQFQMYVLSLTGPLNGYYKVNYLKG